MNRPRRKRCGICEKPGLRLAVNAALLRHASERSIAKDFRISKTAVHRHKGCRRIRLAGDDRAARLEQVARWLEFLADNIRELRLQGEGQQ